MEDYTVYTPLDVAGDRLQNVAATSFNIVALDNDEAVRLIRTNISAFSLAGDFHHSFSLNVTASTNGVFYPWAVSVDSATQIDVYIAANADLLCLKWNADRTVTLTECNGGSLTNASSSALSLSTAYYFRVIRDESVGTYGKLYCFIYSDDNYATLVDSMVVTLTEKKDLLRVWGMSALSAGGGGTSLTATMANLNIDPYFYYTQKTLRTRLRDMLNLATSSTAFFTDAQLNSIIDEAQREIAEKTLCLQDIISLATSSGIRTLTGMGSYYNLSALEYITNSRSLREILVSNVGRTLPKTTAPEFYFEDNDIVGIEPLPAATYNLSGYLSKPPTNLTGDTYLPNIKPAFRQLILWGALAKALAKMENTREAGTLFYAIFLHEAKYLMQEYIDIYPDSLKEINYYA